MPRRTIKVMEEIKLTAKEHVISWDMFSTVITMLLVIFFAFVFRKPDGGVYLVPTVLLFVCTAAAIFGIIDNFPHLLYLYKPMKHPLFRGQESKEEKTAYAQQIDRQIKNEIMHEFPDLIVTRKYFVFEGNRCFDVIPINQTVGIYQTIFASRSKQGIHILVFVDRDGRRHSLLLHSGKEDDPMGQMSRICDIMAKEAPHIIFGKTKDAPKIAQEADKKN